MTLVFFETFDYSILFLSILPVTLTSSWTGSKFGTIGAAFVLVYNIFILNISGNTGIIFEFTFIGSSAVMILLAWMVGKIKDVNTELNNELDRRKKIEEKLTRSKEKIKKLHDTAREFERCRSEEEIFKLVIETTKNISEFDWAKIIVPQENTFKVKETSNPGRVESKDPVPLPDSFLNDPSLKEEPTVYEEVNHDGYSEFSEVEASEKRSVITIPIRDETIFMAGSKKKDIEENREVLKLLCDHAGEALKRLEIAEREEFLHSLLRHDIRNKINVVRRYLELIKNLDLQDQGKEYVERAEKVVKKSDELTEKIQTLSRMEEEKTLQMNAAKAIGSSIEKNKSLADEKNIEIEKELIESHVKGGPLLEELFSNLIENSLKHSKGSQIRVKMEDKESKLDVIVEDDGKGIPPEQKTKIFEKGYRKGEEAGSGLGMYLVKEIAKNYGAKVKVKESELGGTQFKVPLEKM